MRQLRRVIRPGSKLLNWSSLGISDFVQKSGAVSRREITLLEVELFTYFSFMKILCHVLIQSFTTMLNCSKYH
jgi:hypothetical protein